MKVFIKLFTLTIIVIVALSVYFEFCVNRPLNSYIQYMISTIMIILIVLYLVYMVKQIIKILNP